MGSNFKAAIGIGQPLVITANCDTWLKRSPIDSTLLDITKKQRFAEGETIQAYTSAINGDHLSIDSIDTGKLGHWYLFLEHINFEKKPKELLTFHQLSNIAIHTDLDRLKPLVTPLNEAMTKYQINTPLRIAHFIAQVAHESDGFNALEEYASGADYEWRDDLGNTQEGDGVRYKGRGLICVTGRFNYASISKDLGVDFVSNPELLANPKYSAISAAWFWNRESLNLIADRDDIIRITRTVNGGTNGLADRKSYLSRAKIALGL